MEIDYKMTKNTHAHQIEIEMTKGTDAHAIKMTSYEAQIGGGNSRTHRLH